MADYYGTGTVDPFDTLDPVVTNAHLQSGSGHGAGDGYAEQGGVTAALASVYVDYDSIVETNPDKTTFSYQLDQAGVSDVESDSYEDETDTITPAPHQFTFVDVLDGAIRVIGGVAHLDKYGNTHSDTTTYYVKPYTPQAPTVDNYVKATDQVDVTIVPHASEHADVPYAIQCTTGDPADVGDYVQADGSLSAAAIWQTIAVWGTVTVQLTSEGAGTVGFKIVAQNYYSAATLSTLSAEGTSPTSIKPTVSSLVVAQSAAGDVGISFTADDGDDDPLKFKVEIKKTAGGSYGDFVETLTVPIVPGYGATPDINNGNEYQVGTVTPLATTSGANTLSFRWDAKTDQDEEDENYTIKVTPASATELGVGVETTFDVDTTDPVAIAIENIGQPLSGNTTIVIRASWTETHPDVNMFGGRLNGAGGWTEETGTPNTASPADKIIVLPGTYYGDDIINYRCIHTDDFSNTATQEDSIGVKPLTPLVLTISAVGIDVASFNITENPLGVLGVLEYAIAVSGGSSGYVQTDGTIDVAAAWQTDAVWGTKQVTGLVPSSSYTFICYARNPNSTAIISDASPSAIFNTLSNDPEINSTITITPPTDGSKTYQIDYSVRDEYRTALTVVLQYRYGGIWYTAVGGSGDIGPVTYAEAYPAYEAFTIQWNAATDLDNIEDPALLIRLNISNDTGGSDSQESSSFSFDTRAPYGGGGISVASQGTTDLDIVWVVPFADANFDSYELWVSSLSIAEALTRVPSGTCSLWDKNDDGALGSAATLVTTITPLVVDTNYYIAWFAKDTFGNVSLVGGTLTTYTLSDTDLSGIVRDQNGYVVGGATVYLYRRDTGALVDSVVAGADGSFVFQGGYPVTTTFMLVYYKEISATLFWGAGIIDGVEPVEV